MLRRCQLRRSRFRHSQLRRCHPSSCHPGSSYCLVMILTKDQCACSNADPEPSHAAGIAAKSAEEKAARRAAREARRQKRLDELDLDIVDSDDQEAEALIEALAEAEQNDGGFGSVEMWSRF